ncbi:MAG: nitronate monooxygenase [Chrysiogenetes bacterium]|nr:nitronate monooxygenase [Chrysiogenetes bacterium]
MKLPTVLKKNLKVPVIAAPMYIVSGLELVIEQCKSGVIGSFPALNARGEGEFERWLVRINKELGGQDAAYAVNLIVNPKTNKRLQEDLQLCVKYKVPIVITSLGAMEEVNEAVHSYGGIVLHDVINNRFAKKAIEKGADGLVAVAAGAGGHGGVTSPFALIQEIRTWFDGPLALSGSIASGHAILAAQAIGADLAYIGSAFIATEEANAVDDYKAMITKCDSGDIVYTDYFTGVNGNYLLPSITRSGMDPGELTTKGQGEKAAIKTAPKGGPKVWKEIWGSGQGIGAIDRVLSTKDLVGRFVEEYETARRRLERAA